MTNRPASTFTTRIRGDLNSLAEELGGLLAESAIEWVDLDGIIGLSPYQWCEPSPALRLMQHGFLTPWDDWARRFLLLVSKFPADLRKEAKSHCKKVRYLASREGGSSWSVPESMAEAIQMAEDHFDSLRKMIDVAEQSGSPRTVLIPDTNSVYQNPALETYWRCLQSDRDVFDVVLVAQVVRELDRHKGDGSNAPRQKKAQAFIKRVRALAERGSLERGVAQSDRVTGPDLRP